MKDKVDAAEIVIISGTAPGADRLGERYAKEREYKLECYPADWGHYGNAAGPIRNMNMADIADDVIVFWDGESSGTKNMIETAKAKNIPCTVIKI